MESEAVTLTQLRYFARVAELGSMSAAADDLAIAQSAISMAISQLEKSIGCQLLIRRPAKGVALTEQGIVFRQRALQILTEVNNAIDLVKPGTLGGRLTAGCFTTLSAFWIPATIDHILKHHPTLDVTIREYSAPEIELALQQCEVEVALAYDFDYGREVEFRPMGSAPLHVVVGRQSQLFNADSVSLKELVGEPMILLDMGKSNAYFQSVFYKLGLEPNIKYRFESFETVRSMVARGFGYTLLNQKPHHEKSNEGLPLKHLKITDSDESLRIGIVHRRGERLSLRAEAFAEAVKGVFKNS